LDEVEKKELGFFETTKKWKEKEWFFFGLKQFFFKFLKGKGYVIHKNESRILSEILLEIKN